MRLGRLGWTALGGLAVVAAAGFVTGCGHRGEPVAPSAAARTVNTITVQPVATEIDAEVPGLVRPVLEARLAPKIMSKVTTVTVRAGDRVTRGEVLVRLENRDLSAGVAQSAAAVAAARAGENQAQTALAMQRVTSGVEVRQAEDALYTAQANLAKVRQGPRPEQRQQAEQAVASAQAAVSSAQAQLTMLREGARQQERAQAGEAVTRAQQGAAAAHQGVLAAAAGVRTAQADYNRMENLVAQGVVPQQRLDHATLQLATAQAQLAQAQAGEQGAQAAVEQARQQQSLVTEGPRTQQIQEAEQAVAQAQAGEKQAQLDLEMAVRGGRREDVVAAQAAVDQAEQAVRNAHSAQARNQLRESDVQVAQAQVGQASAAEQAAGVMLGYSVLTAPFSGVVTARFVDPGSMATPGVPILVVADDSQYRLEATVPENLASYLHVGGPVKVRLDALDAEWNAEVVQMIPAADPSSHTLLVKASLPPDARIYSGLFGRLVLPTGQREALTVPDTALWRQGSLTGVFVVASGKAELRMVQLGTEQDGATEINSGLSAGDVVATDATGLTDGMAVQAATAPPAGPPPPATQPEGAQPPGTQPEGTTQP